MRHLVSGIDNRGLLEGQGHSKLWSSRMGEVVERLDVLVETRLTDRLQELRVAPNVRIIPVPTPHPLLYPFFALLRALREHRRHRYQTISCEDPFRPGLAAYLFRRITGVPLCVEYHTDCFFNPVWIAERPLINRAYTWIGRHVVRAAEAARVVNAVNRDELRRLCAGLPDKPIAVIPVPTRFYEPDFDAEEACRLRRELLGADADTGGILILFVGRLIPVKRVDELLRLFSRLRPLHRTARLVIVGDGPEYAALRRLAAELGESRIDFRGSVEEAEVFPYYGAADLFVNLSARETYGRVFMEAMSAGLPVVAVRHSGAVADGLVVDGESGLTFDPDDPAGTEQAVVRLLTDPALRRRLGDKGRAVLQRRHSYLRRIEQVRQLWDLTLAAGRKGATLAPVLAIGDDDDDACDQSPVLAPGNEHPLSR